MLPSQGRETGSIPVSRSINCWDSLMVEQRYRKPSVPGSSPGPSSYKYEKIRTNKK